MNDKIKLLDALKSLPPPQFEEVMLHYGMPPHYLSHHTPQASQAIEAIRYAESRHELARLAQALAKVSGTSPQNPSAGETSVYSQANPQVHQQINIHQVTGNVNLQQAGRDIGGNSSSAMSTSQADAEYHQLLSDKLHALRKALLLETDAAVKFKLEHQIAELESLSKKSG